MSGVKMFYQLLGKEISLIYYNELNLSNWTQQDCYGQEDMKAT